MSKQGFCILAACVLLASWKAEGLSYNTTSDAVSMLATRTTITRHAIGHEMPPNPVLQAGSTYWGTINCQEKQRHPHAFHVGIRMWVKQFPDDITLSIVPLQYRREVSYCRPATTCAAEYNLNVVPGPSDSKFHLHLEPGNGNWNQCDEWPHIGLNGFLTSSVGPNSSSGTPSYDEFMGDLVFSPSSGHEMMLKARDDLGEDSMPPLCHSTEMLIKEGGTDRTTDGYLSCNMFSLTRCKKKEPQGHEWAVYMIKPEEPLKGGIVEPRISAVAQGHSYNMLLNPIMWTATQNSRAEELITIVYMPPTMLAMDTYLYGLHNLAGESFRFQVVLDPGLMSVDHQWSMDSSFALKTLEALQNTSVLSPQVLGNIISQYKRMTSPCAGGKYPDRYWARTAITCGVDPSAASIEALGSEQERLWGWKERMKLSNHKRVLVYADGHFFSDAGLGDLRGGYPDAIQVRVLSENNRWRETSNPHCWHGTS